MVLDLEDWHNSLLVCLRGLPGVSPPALAHFEEFLGSLESALPLAQRAVKVWQFVSLLVLHPAHDFAAHQRLLQATYAQWPASSLGPFPVWVPSTELAKNHNITHFLAQFAGDAAFQAARTGAAHDCALDPGKDYPLLHALSVRDPERVFSVLLLSTLRIPFHTPPRKILDFDPSTHNPDAAVWLPGAQLNIAHCALSAARGALPPGPVDALTAAGSSTSSRGSGKAGDADVWGASACSPARPAMLWAEEGAPGDVHVLTMGELREAAVAVAQALRRRLDPGDAVALIMPMTPAAVAIYLGIILAGCVVVSIAGGRVVWW